MGTRCHIQTKHVIEYAPSEFFCLRRQMLLEYWLDENGVNVNTSGDDWELLKDELRAIPDEAYKDVHGRDYYRDDSDDVITEYELRAFVKECLDADTGDWAYVDWF